MSLLRCLVRDGGDDLRKKRWKKKLKLKKWKKKKRNVDVVAD